ncbi:MAG: hypothetical protein WC768_02370 [Patescibacteria group bacterium]|jgi:hypothetical protein
MKNKFLFLALLFLAIFFTGCQLKENYAMQYSFSNEAAAQVKFEPKTDGVKIEIPFADFGCDPKAYKAVLGRKINTFTITISGTESAQRCAQKFSADISGMVSGDYTFKVVYQKGADKIEVLNREFQIAN